MIYLLDTNVFIYTEKWFGIDRIPQFWNWLLSQAQANTIKTIKEVAIEVEQGNPNDPLVKWFKNSKKSLLLNISVQPYLQRVSDEYQNDLPRGADPSLIAAALQLKSEQNDVTIVSNEVSKPTKEGKNRRIPDVAKTFSIAHMQGVKLYQHLNFTIPLN